MKELKPPKFKSEAEEAEWWDAHMDVVEENLIEAMKNRTAHRGTLRRCCASHVTSLFALTTGILNAPKNWPRRKASDTRH